MNFEKWQEEMVDSAKENLKKDGGVVGMVIGVVHHEDEEAFAYFPVQALMHDPEQLIAFIIDELDIDEPRASMLKSIVEAGQIPSEAIMGMVGAEEKDVRDRMIANFVRRMQPIAMVTIFDAYFKTEEEGGMRGEKKDALIVALHTAKRTRTIMCPYTKDPLEFEEQVVVERGEGRLMNLLKKDVN